MLTVCAFNVNEVRVYVKPAFVHLRSLRLRSGHPQAEAGALLDNLCRVSCPWTLDWVPPWIGPPYPVWAPGGHLTRLITAPSQPWYRGPV